MSAGVCPGRPYIKSAFRLMFFVCAHPIKSNAFFTLCRRPKKFSVLSSRDWTPIDNLFTPHDINSFSFVLSNVPGFDSIVISQSSEILKFLFIFVKIRSNIAVGINDGVPPPKNIVGTSQ